MPRKGRLRKPALVWQRNAPLEPHRRKTTTHGALVSHTNFADTNTCLVWIKRLDAYVAFGRIDGTIVGEKCGFLASEKTHPGNFRQVGAIIETTDSKSSHKATIPFSSRNFSAEPTSIYHIEKNDNVS